MLNWTFGPTARISSSGAARTAQEMPNHGVYLTVVENEHVIAMGLPPGSGICAGQLAALAAAH